jgi:hypothetical protein
MDEYNLQEEIDKYLESKVRPEKERDYFYVSELGKSKKEIYKSFKNKSENKMDGKTHRILDNGNFVHSRFMKLFAEMGILVCAEIDAVSNDLVHGRLDCIITDRKQNYIVEIKSCSQWTFQKLIQPSKAHLLQIQFYMYYMNIQKGIILYECKDNQSIKTFYINLDKELVEKYIEELKKLKEDIIKNNEPNDEPILLEDLQYG